MNRLVAGVVAMTAVVAASNFLVQVPINDWLTWGALSYPVAFLVTDLINRRVGPEPARRVVYVGFACGVVLSLFTSTVRIALASGTAFLLAQLADVWLYDRMRHAAWWRAPLVSSTLASALDTALFFSLAFAWTGLPWTTWAIGDYGVKMAVAGAMLLPFRLLMGERDMDRVAASGPPSPDRWRPMSRRAAAPASVPPVNGDTIPAGDNTRETARDMSTPTASTAPPGMRTTPRSMRAVVLTGHGGLDKLSFRGDWPLPAPGPRQALIAVGACGLNNTDVNTRTGWYSAGVSGPTTGEALGAAGDTDATWGGGAIAFPRIQGADVCGRVVALGAECDTSLLGRRVLIDPWLRDWDDPLDRDKCSYFGSECDGGFAEYTVADARNVHVVESGLPDAELATFATSYMTAENMLNRAAVQPGDRVLVTGASGGVGSALIQLAGRRGAETIALCGETKAAAVKALGTDHVLPRAPEDLEAALLAATGRREVTVVADVVGGPLWPQLIAALARGGRYTCAGAIAGPMVGFDLRTFYLRDLVFTGATIPPPGVFADLVGYIERGEIEPLLAATYPLHDLAAAQAAFIAKRHTGNIVVTTSADG